MQLAQEGPSRATLSVDVMVKRHVDNDFLPHDRYMDVLRRITDFSFVIYARV